MNTSTFLTELMQAIAKRGGRLLSLGSAAPVPESNNIGRWCETLLSNAGEASGTAIAAAILRFWHELDDAGRKAFMILLRDEFGVDHRRLYAAVLDYVGEASDATALALHQAAEPRRQDLFRRLNLAVGGVETLVRMREDLLLRRIADDPGLKLVDADFVHLFSSWFNRGFLMLKRIDWTTPANILEKIIRYEAVHEIGSWDDLRRRLQPADRRCYAFFHPQLPDEPLIFVEVALTREMPAAIAPLLSEERPAISDADATCAVFYSISNCQEGLRGISFGNFLIKQVVEDMKRELPGLTDFVTLSPVPGFAAWLAALPDGDEPAGAAEAKALVSEQGWDEEPETLARLSELLPHLAARYFLVARTAGGRVVDPVARFHLGNGASLARINAFGDRSAKALGSALGLMVNYRYRLDEVERNHERFVSAVEVPAASSVQNLLRAPRATRRGKGPLPTSRPAA